MRMSFFQSNEACQDRVLKIYPTQEACSGDNLAVVYFGSGVGKTSAEHKITVIFTLNCQKPKTKR